MSKEAEELVLTWEGREEKDHRYPPALWECNEWDKEGEECEEARRNKTRGGGWEELTSPRKGTDRSHMPQVLQPSHA